MYGRVAAARDEGGVGRLGRFGLGQFLRSCRQERRAKHPVKRLTSSGRTLLIEVPRNDDRARRPPSHLHRRERPHGYGARTSLLLKGSKGLRPSTYTHPNAGGRAAQSTASIVASNCTEPPAGRRTVLANGRMCGATERRFRSARQMATSTSSAHKLLGRSDGRMKRAFVLNVHSVAA